jgi:Glycosyl hydrolase family 20, domain 2
MNLLNKTGSFLLIALVSGLLACQTPKSAEEQTILVDVLPMPNKILKRGGSITMSNDFWVVANVSDSVSSALATYLVSHINTITGSEAHVTDLYSTRKHPQSVKLVLNNSTATENSESYTLDLTSSHIIIDASTSQGIFFGIQTFLQLLKSGTTQTKSYVLPKVVIKDSPRYKVRGVTIKDSQLNGQPATKLFDLMGAVKINSIFIEGEKWYDQYLLADAAKNYVKIYNASELLNDISILSYDVVDEKLEGILASKINTNKLNGFVLDLTSTPSEDFLKKLKIISELSWSNNDNEDFAERIKVSRGENLSN